MVFRMLLRRWFDIEEKWEMKGIYWLLVVG